MENKRKEKKIDSKKLGSSLDHEVKIFIGETISSIFGVVGLTSLDGDEVELTRNEFFKGVKLVKVSDTKYDIEVHLILCYGLRVAEVLNEVTKRLEYFLSKKYGKIYRKINVYCENLKVL